MSTFIKSEMTAEPPRELLAYDAGAFTWIESRGRVKAGAVAGSLTSRGYVQIMIDGRRYYAHRLAWLYVHGRWPDGQIDHVNGVRTDNRIENLREASRSVNQQNRRRSQSNNKLGLLGVRKYRGRFQAEIRIDGKTKYLGRFDSPEEAHAAYVEAKRRLHAGCTI